MWLPRLLRVWNIHCQVIFTYIDIIAWEIIVVDYMTVNPLSIIWPTDTELHQSRKWPDDGAYLKKSLVRYLLRPRLLNHKLRLHNFGKILGINSPVAYLPIPAERARVDHLLVWDVNVKNNRIPLRFCWRCFVLRFPGVTGLAGESERLSRGMVPTPPDCTEQEALISRNCLDRKRRRVGGGW